MKATSVALLPLLIATPAMAQQTDGAFTQVDRPIVLAQADSGGGASMSLEEQTMKFFADMICDQNPYTNQSNSVTGEKTGPMLLVDGQRAVEVLANNYSREWEIGGRKFFIRKVVLAPPYQFDTTRNGQSTGKRQERVIIIYAGNDSGPG